MHIASTEASRFRPNARRPGSRAISRKPTRPGKRAMRSPKSDPAPALTNWAATAARYCETLWIRRTPSRLDVGAATRATSGAGIRISIHHPSAAHPHRTGLCSAASKPDAKETRWLPPKNVPMLLVHAFRPMVQSIAALIAKEWKGKQKWCASAGTITAGEMQ